MIKIQNIWGNSFQPFYKRKNVMRKTKDVGEEGERECTDLANTVFVNYWMGSGPVLTNKRTFSFCNNETSFDVRIRKIKEKWADIS